MAIIPILPGNLDHFEIVGRPYSKFVSGSHIAPTGSVELVREKSKSIKDVQVRSEFGSGPIVEDSYLSVLGTMQQNNFAQLTITISSGSYASGNTPTSIDIKTKCHRNKSYKFCLKTNPGQVIDTKDIYQVPIDIQDVAPPDEISAGSFTVGKKYKITSIGTTNFKNIGASRNSVGIEFTASGVGSGSGKAIFNSVRVIADRIQLAMNKNLQGDSPTGVRFFRHFLVANPVKSATHNQTYTMQVQYLKTSVYDGGIRGFRVGNNVSHAEDAQITIGDKVIPEKRNLSNDLDVVMNLSNNQPITADQNKKLRVIRFEPSVKFTKDTMRKNVVKDVLYPSYRKNYPNLHWSYTNYHCLNFFTGSGIPDDSAILYLNKLKPKFSVELEALKLDELNSKEFTINHASAYVTPDTGFSVEGVTAIAATAVGCIDFKNIEINDTLTFMVPAAAGGSGTNTVIKYVSDNPSSTLAYIQVAIANVDPLEIRKRTMGAINGNQVSADGHTIRWETGGGSSGIEGITATGYDHLGQPRMTLTAATAGSSGNEIVITASKNAGVVVPGKLTLDNKLSGGSTAPKVLVLNSTKVDHETRGRYIKLNRKIPRGNRSTVSFKVIKPMGGYAQAVARIDLDPSKDIRAFHNVRITMRNSHSTSTEKTFILDYFGTETAENFQVLVDISSAATANDIAEAIKKSIYLDSPGSRQTGGWLFSGLQQIHVDNLVTSKVASGLFVVGEKYTILEPRGTDFTALGSADKAIGTTFTATSAGTGPSSSTAGSFTPGVHYVIKSLGTTNFTAIGASENTVGTEFVASAAGAGTGTAISIVGVATQTRVDGNYLRLRKQTAGGISHNTPITVTGDNVGVLATAGFFGAADSDFVTYAKVSARGINVIKTQDIIVTDVLNINVPTAAGGSNANVTINFVNSLPAASNDTISILWDASSAITDRQSLIIDAINGVAREGKIQYASAGGNNGGQSGVAGVDAVTGDSGGSITLIATQAGPNGDQIAVSEGTGDDILLDTSLTLGKLVGDSENAYSRKVLKPSPSVAAVMFIRVTTNYDEGDLDDAHFAIQSAEQEVTEYKAGTFKSGASYTITEAGNTDFTLIGSANSNVGTTFQANGVGAGTGKATLKGIMYKTSSSTSYTGQYGVGADEGKVIIGTLGIGSGNKAHASLAAKIREALLSPNGHNGKIKAVLEDGGVNGTFVRMTQRKKGREGMTSLSTYRSWSGTNATNSNWEDGVTGSDLVIQYSTNGSTWLDMNTVDLQDIKNPGENEWTKVNFEIDGDHINTDYYVRLVQKYPEGISFDDFDEHVIISDFKVVLDHMDFEASLPYPYSPREKCTFSFWVKPKIVDLDKNDSYKAGTILHLSSSYAFSIVSGSTVDSFGRPNKFGLVCQFGSSTDVSPSRIPLVKHADASRGWEAGKRFVNGEYPRDGRVITRSSTWKDNADHIFLSSENALSGDHWHHVAIRWSAEKDHRSGSIFIDGNLDSTFLLNSASCMPSNMPDSRGDPSVLSIGNYYDGRNDGNEGALQSQFFNGNASYQEGLPIAYKISEKDVPNYQIDNFLYRDPNDVLFQYENPLKAEVHEIKIYNDFKTHHEIKNEKGIQKSLPERNLVFYLPVHFTPETPKRDVMQTPFQTFRTTTNDPFNVALSFGVGGKTMNLPNFLREHVTGKYPRLLNLTASAITTTDTKSRSADEWLNSVPSHRKGNYTVLPCDNGLFNPNYLPILTGTQTTLANPASINYSYRDDNGYSRAGMVSLRGMVTSSILPKTPGHLLQDPAVRESSIDAYLEGANPEDPGLTPGAILSVYNRTRDPDSNEVVFFDISNMFYGNRIAPETMQIKDTSLSGTRGSVSITLKDDGVGNVYRHDCLTAPAKWNNIGDVIYDEGIVTIKNPILSHFGRRQFEISFRGEQKIPVMEITVPVTRNSFNSSSNPNYLPLAPTSDASETAEDFVYISGVNLHDENLNIIGKANFAQPVIKRKSDSFMIKLKMDF